MRQRIEIFIRRTASVVALAMVLLVAACALPPETTDRPATPDAAVTGNVRYLQRSALAPGSVITVQVQDVSRVDAPAEVIGEQVIVTTGEQVPVPFEVPYSSADIIDNHTYAVRATIEDATGRLLFTSDTFTPVITSGAPTSDVDILVVPVAGSAATPEPDAAVTGTVSYLQRIALTPGSIISVRVQDTSLADAPAVTIGEQVIVTTDEQVPVPFAVGYHSADIVDNHTYSIRATIEDAAGNLLFTTDTFTPVITNGAPTSDIELLLVQVP